MDNSIHWLCRTAMDHLHMQDVREAVEQLHAVLYRYQPGDGIGPRYRIYSLGRFVVVGPGGAMQAANASQRTPLELLKLTIALGGSDVSIAALTEALWPDADGDSAHARFKIALHRLRRLLGSRSILRVGDGTLTFEESEAWVDAWAFERWFDTCYATHRGKAAFDVGEANNMLRLYKGAFLGANAPTLALPCRERLRSKFFRSVFMLGHDRELQKAWKEAIDVYERGVDIDPTAEDFYQRLIVCYSELGQRSQAADAYRRCQATLDAMLQTAPTRKTQSLYEGASRGATFNHHRDGLHAYHGPIASV